MGGVIGDAPIAGLYKIRRVRRGPWVGVRIWHDDNRFEPGNPENRLDRSSIWRAERDGEEVELARVWPHASFNPIDKSEYLFLLRDASHARQNRPGSPEANPTKTVDVGAMPAIF